MKTRVIFCANQVSLAIASSLLSVAKVNETFTIVYDSKRCDPEAFPSINKYAFAYNRVDYIWLLLKSLFVRPSEVVLPHFKWTAAKILALFAKQVSFIDDGLDIFREHPRNIDQKKTTPVTSFYTFNYQIPLASWTTSLKVHPICPIEYMAVSSRKTVNFNNFKTVVIESPGVENYINNILDIPQNTLLVRHSNPNKKINFKFKIDEISGSDYALERSLTNFEGNVIVGESMVAVYLMMIKEPKFQLSIYIKSESLNNLLTFKRMSDSLTHVKLISYA